MQFPANMQFIMFDMDKLSEFVDGFDSQLSFKFPIVEKK